MMKALVLILFSINFGAIDFGDKIFGGINFGEISRIARIIISLITSVHT